MKLFINAVNLSSAGGLNVALNFLNALNQCRPDDLVFYVAAPRHCGYEALATAGTRTHLLWVPDWANGPVLRPYVDYVWLPAQIRKVGPDVVFTMGNFATPTLVRQAVLLQSPYPAYPNERDVWARLDGLDTLIIRVRNAVFGRRLKHAAVLLVQTETIRARIQTLYPQLPSVRLLPNAYAPLTGQTYYALPFVKEAGLWYLVCLSRYYTHKNIEVLVDVARLVRQRNLPYRILLTIEPAQHRNARRLLNRIRREGLSEYIINIGTAPMTGVASLYGQVDGLLLPTLLESFSATYVDAMHLGLPIFTSQRDFAEDVCGDYAYYFDPLSAESIVSAISRGFDDPALLQQTIANARLRSADLPDWTRVAQIGLDVIRSLNDQASADETPLPVEVLTR